MDIKRTEYAIFIEKRGKWAKLTEKVYNSAEKAEEAAKSANLTDKYRIMSRVVLFVASERKPIQNMNNP